MRKNKIKKVNTKKLNYKKDYSSNGMQNSLHICKKTNTNCKEWVLELPSSSFFHKKYYMGLFNLVR